MKRMWWCARFSTVAVASAVVAIGLSVGTAAAAAVPCGAAITVNTVLTSDMNCPQQGVLINASNITLDLGGHTITGAGPATVASAPFGITAGVRFNGNVTGSVVKNGRITGFNSGATVVSQGADGNEIAGLTLANNSNGITLQSGQGGAPTTTNQYIHDNTVVQSTSQAIVVTGNSHRIERNTVDLSSTGLSVNGDGNQISGNRITKSTFTGINFIGNANGTSDNNRVTGNIVTDNGGSGIALAGDGNVVSGNEVSGNQFNGIQLVVQNLVFANNRIESNTVDNNSRQPNFPGIFIGGSTGAVVSGNRVTNTQSTGIHIGTGAVGTVVSSNQVLRNTADGIGVRSGSSSSRVIGNYTSSNGDDGIDADVPSVVVQGNSAYANADWGIEAVSPSVNGGGNHASGNGNPGQCQNFACLP